MGLDLERIMFLMQRRYNALKEMKRLTFELQDAGERGDQVSVSLILQMRADEMEKIEKCQEEVWLMAELGQEEARVVCGLMRQELTGTGEGMEPYEKRIFEIRKKTADLLLEVKAIDRAFNQRMAGDKSYYESKR